MQVFGIRWCRFFVSFSLLALSALFSTNIFALPTHTLNKSEWSLISIPADPGASGTVEELLGDDLPPEDYGLDGLWALFSYDAEANQYQALELSDSLSLHTGYWIVQLVADTVELDLPGTLRGLTGSAESGCPADQLCVSKKLVAAGREKTWNLVGMSTETALTFGATRIKSANAACTDGCTPSAASTAQITDNKLVRYTGTEYEIIDESKNIQAWEGYWLQVKVDAQEPVWVMPVGEISDPGPDGSLTAAELDAGRILLQGSFGPTEADIDKVISMGGAEAWIDDQLLQPPSLHLPTVLQLFPEYTNNNHQQGRYRVFWDRSRNAPDQLRQRVALALSEIMVISDKNGHLGNNGNMPAGYYDVLLNNAFGNFRQLLQDVTLHPAMGVYLSMLGNDKPNDATGRRSDENYARELMQLFTIGLVQLNLDGSERSGEATYTQEDVENLARVFTGWSYDKGSWTSNSRGGWRPDRATLDKPMVAYEDHHDTAAKVFLGNDLPAGQTALADLNAALDILHNHPNVGPFICKQLIMRLVTSNPTPDYVRRCAQTFNNNGDDTRGDLTAVVRAILLDDQARNPALVKRTDYGKLREPLLRYTHLFRAFRAQETIILKRYQSNQTPQLVALTAPSVFNFFSPKYAPVGAINDAGLVAPEFQITPESQLNVINRRMMFLIHKDEFMKNDVSDNTVRLNFSKELSLLDDPPKLMTHFNRLLLAGSMTEASKKTLTEYISANRGEIEDDILIRDIVGLVIMSTEYAVQR